MAVPVLSRVGLCFLWFYIREQGKDQLAVVLVLNVPEDGVTASSPIRHTGEARDQTRDPWVQGK